MTLYRNGIDEAQRIQNSLLEEGCRVVAECLTETPGKPTRQAAGGEAMETA